jgi:hypothetical protein
MSAHLGDDQISRLLGGTLPDNELAHVEPICGAAPNAGTL